MIVTFGACPYCGHVITAMHDEHAKTQPQSGDLALCARCLGVCELGSRLRPFAVNEDALSAIDRDDIDVIRKSRPIAQVDC